MEMNGLGKFTLTTFCALALSGCSGGTGGVGETAGLEIPGIAETDERPVDLTERRRLNNEHQGLYNTIKNQWSYPATLPTSGIANYNGYAGFSNEGGEDQAPPMSIVSKVALNLYLGSGEATASMWDFTDANGKQAAGSVQLTGTQGFKRSTEGLGPQGEGVAYANAKVALSGSGTLDWGGGQQQELTVALDGSVADIRSSTASYDPENPAPTLNNYGAIGDMTVNSTMLGMTTEMDGTFAVKSDQY